MVVVLVPIEMATFHPIRTRPSVGCEYQSMYAHSLFTFTFRTNKHCFISPGICGWDEAVSFAPRFRYPVAVSLPNGKNSPILGDAISRETRDLPKSIRYARINVRHGLDLTRSGGVEKLARFHDRAGFVYLTGAL